VTVLYFIPGYLGSQLAQGGKKAPIWVDTIRTPLEHDKLRLNAEGTGPYNPDIADCTVRAVLPGYYDYCMEAMSALAKSRGDTFVAWPYDFRKDLLSTAEDLALDILKRCSIGNPARLVGHSTGGVLAILANQYLFNLGSIAAIYRVVTLGSPIWGCFAPVATFLLQRDEIRQALAWVNQNVPVNLTGAALLALNIAAKEFAYDMGSWPGLYCLLPNPLAPTGTHDPSASLILDPAFYQEIAPWVMPKWLAYFKDTVAPAMAKSIATMVPGRFVTVKGGQNATFYKTPGKRGALLDTTPVGDGTVTWQQCTLPGYTNWWIDIGHAGIPDQIAKSKWLARAIYSDPPEEPLFTTPLVPKLGFDKSTDPPEIVALPDFQTPLITPGSLRPDPQHRLDC
jgi:pimeloyl-ACP methyl ester carboxylesterase